MPTGRLGDLQFHLCFLDKSCGCFMPLHVTETPGYDEFRLTASFAGEYRRSPISKVIFNDPATVVFWIDGTKTVVKCQPGDKFDKMTGLAMAISKKFLGNNGRYYNVIKEWVEEDK